jgi:hypothetical protein
MEKRLLISPVVQVIGPRLISTDGPFEFLEGKKEMSRALSLMTPSEARTHKEPRGSDATTARLFNSFVRIHFFKNKLK